MKIDPKVFLDMAKRVYDTGNPSATYQMSFNDFDYFIEMQERGDGQYTSVSSMNADDCALFLCLAAAIAADPANR